MPDSCYQSTRHVIKCDWYCHIHPNKISYLIGLDMPASYCLYSRYALVMQAPTWVPCLLF